MNDPGNRGQFTIAALAERLGVPPVEVAKAAMSLGFTNTMMQPLTVQNVLSVDAFTRAINQAQGTNTVLQHLHFSPGQSTLWHTHPGPNIVLVVGGSLTLTDNHCNVSTYTDGQGFATGLDEHLAIAGAQGADFYSLYFLPADATVLRTPDPGQSASPPPCAS